MLEQIDSFLNDKEFVNMSSYKTDAKIGKPIKYLQDTKKALWKRFAEEYPNGSLCSTCNDCDYMVFEDTGVIISAHVIDESLKFGYNVDNEDNIESAVKDIAGVQVVNLNPNRNNGKVKLQLVYVVKLEIDLIFIINLDKTKLGTITGISNLQEWIWPTDEEKVSYIHAYALLGIEE
ncbi:hypothetical protein RclHR1_07610004 [Rhizophagus clarus]|uniref:Uncharacterized protein n=1 Tax=Rhizophagus clarus TaxID=94130 RepID=A0A2Z6RXV2_9GLOM|nr:hypothetical protein RclHR1_07610004 [Rhizophagus clarus]